MDLTDTCETQLVEVFNGINPRIGFLKSNQYPPAGLKHDLHFILNVFRENEITSEMESPHMCINDIFYLGPTRNPDSLFCIDHRYGSWINYDL